MRHYGRWVAGVIILFLAFIVVRSVVTNVNLDWPTVWAYMFNDRVLRGLQNTSSSRSSRWPSASSVAYCSR